MAQKFSSARHTNDWSSIAINKPCDVFKLFIGLVYGKITGIPPYLKVKTMVSCRFSLKPIQWILDERNRDLYSDDKNIPGFTDLSDMFNPCRWFNYHPANNKYLRDSCQSFGLPFSSQLISQICWWKPDLFWGSPLCMMKQTRKTNNKGKTKHLGKL
jgi:hypothetical protein